ncbi:DUF952 domain-containing protein [Myxacorys almedinensis]|uniref:DUF952 domain-containing protein n=1 Tax=Myxacorys almedinensis A TaxID=2690445 RepID=A0A8J7YXL2_9CYAN|nr:DUF952 domain-containing protein [Myxacorys almedinensis]NDJ16527.1 DUF952 domain-containing protein [Myxacorys almedinensis A]
MALIVHITQNDQWQHAKLTGFYRGDTLDSEGFIHCSRPDQVVWVANQLYRGQSSLVLLCIEPKKVRAEIKYEGLEGGEAFPHVYGALNVDAIAGVLPFEPEADGHFTLPDELTTP